MATYHLAQLNVARMKAPLESPGMSDFVDNLESINRLAESSAGYVWRLETDDGDATALRPFGDDMLVNLSVWENLDALRAFVFESAHKAFLKRRSEWFDRLDEAYTVLWWQVAGELPDLELAGSKLAQLRSEGPSRDAFSFRINFPAPGNQR